MNMNARILATLVFLSALAAHPALAHDLWIEPSLFSPPPGARVSLRLKVGHPNRRADPVPRDPELFDRFVVEGEGVATPVLGIDGMDPAGWIRVAEEGSVTVRYETPALAHELPGAQFQAYLAEEGLEHVAGRRLARGEAGEPGRELYSRCVAALLTVGGANEAPPARRSTASAGCPLDVRLDGDPALFRPGGRLGVQLSFEGRPVSGVEVELSTLAGGPSLERTARTDDGGRAELELSGDGPWLLTAVHMVQSRTADADWRSYWTAWTFGPTAPDGAPAVSR